MPAEQLFLSFSNVLSENNYSQGLHPALHTESGCIRLSCSLRLGEEFLLSVSGSVSQSLNISTHIVNAVYIVRTNTIILWFMALLGITSTLNSLFADTAFHGLLFFIAVFVSLCATPIIYGIYFEIIEDSYSSIGAIAKKYVPQYIWLLLRLYIPVLFFAMLPAMSDPNNINEGSFQMFVVVCSLLFIYIIPCYYVQGSQKGAVTLGLAFLYKHLTASAPLILISLLTEAALILFELKKETLMNFSQAIYITADFSLYMTANIIDFVLFVTMVFIVKEQFQPTAESE